MITTTQAEKMVDILPKPAHIKCGMDLSYLYSNKINASMMGVNSPEFLYGKKAEDLIALKGKSIITPDHADFVQSLDRRVVETSEPIMNKSRYVTFLDGLIHYQDIYKVPLFGYGDKVIAVFTYSEDRTEQINLMELLATYLSFYKNKKKVCIKIARYTKLTESFFQIPSFTELYVLFCMVYHGSQRSHIGNQLGTSFKTIQKHIDALKFKLNHGVTLKSVIYGLRSRNFVSD